jgi:hypothetical protein
MRSILKQKYEAICALSGLSRDLTALTSRVWLVNKVKALQHSIILSRNMHSKPRRYALPATNSCRLYCFQLRLASSKAQVCRYLVKLRNFEESPITSELVVGTQRAALNVPIPEQHFNYYILDYSFELSFM